MRGRCLPLIRKVVETIQVESAEKLEVTFKDGDTAGW